ncbi:MAG: HIT family protein [Rhodospirillales bacterium CG15_BIG_FIL_POST_REV_8_21_14_020_66_15]|nr:MAG: HIT family protein [Rhodospirillales bacterium CG15_BIG_FIL_POST_REV_8_21_14_020_66_15]
MTQDTDCIFCKIVAGQVPCFKLAEDVRALAFMDISPANPGHALVIAKAHAPDLFAVDPEDLTAVVRLAQRVAAAIRDELDPPGMNLLQANGPAAAQSVAHFHVHVLPRRMDDGLAMNWRLAPGNMDVIAALAERLRDRVTS